MTTAPVKTLAFCGSLRKASYNRMLLKTAIGLAPEGMVVELAEIDGLPVYNADLHRDSLPAQVERLCDQTAAAEALLFATPEYNHSIPAPLKNASTGSRGASPSPSPASRPRSWARARGSTAPSAPRCICATAWSSSTCIR